MEKKTTESKFTNYADRMGPELKAVVEKQLLEDLKHYKIDKPALIIDWANSSPEGRAGTYLDGTVANFSGILVLDEKGNIVADGWMEFILENNFFLAYWDHVTTREGKKKLGEKQMPGIPKQVWKQIPEELKEKYKRKKM